MALWTQLTRILFINSAKADSFLMPEQGTALSKQIDNLYGFLVVVSFVSCAILIGGSGLTILTTGATGGRAEEAQPVKTSNRIAKNFVYISCIA